MFQVSKLDVVGCRSDFQIEPSTISSALDTYEARALCSAARLLAPAREGERLEEGRTDVEQIAEGGRTLGRGNSEET